MDWRARFEPKRGHCQVIKCGLNHLLGGAIKTMPHIRAKAERVSMLHVSARISRSPKKGQYQDEQRRSLFRLGKSAHPPSLPYRFIAL